jgi:hypothetical protein
MTALWRNYNASLIPAAEAMKPFGERILRNQKWTHLSCCNCAFFSGHA